MPAAFSPPPMRSPPRLLFMGMAGLFSALPLAALLRAGLPVAAVLLPAPPAECPITRRLPPVRRSLPLLDGAEPNSLDLAWRHDLPVYAASRLDHPETLATLAALRPDLVCIACFPRRVPDSLLALAPLGGVNLHPSLLPAHRGPAPRFWTFRHGLTRSGVTVHQVTRVLDAGPILARAAFDLPEGMTGAEFDRQAATLGGDLLVEVARALATGTATPAPQDEARASYDLWPRPADYLVAPDRPARWAFNFIRGVAGDGGPLAVLIGDQAAPVVEALTYRPAGSLGSPWRVEDGTLWLQCAPGLLHVRLAAPVSCR